MTSTDNKKVSDKILERIRALLAMGNDTSSEHEAAIALKRARSLMDEHQVTLHDIEKLTVDDLGQASFDSGSSKQKRWVSALALAVANMNDCVVDIQRLYNMNYVFKGFKEDVLLCEFMLVYLVETCNRLYERDKKILGLWGVADKNDYLKGISRGISIRIATIIVEREKSMSKNSNSRSLVITKSAIVSEKYGEQKTKKPKASSRSVNGEAYIGGRIASEEVSLGSFVEHQDHSAGAIKLTSKTQNHN